MEIFIHPDVDFRLLTKPDRTGVILQVKVLASLLNNFGWHWLT